MPKLTLKRAHPKDHIYLTVTVTNPATNQSATRPALFDTGADHTVISKALADEIGLKGEGTLGFNGAFASSVATKATVSMGILFDGAHPVNITDHEVALFDQLSGDVLLGRDFLEWFDVTISRDGTFTLSH